LINETREGTFAAFLKFASSIALVVKPLPPPTLSGLVLRPSTTSGRGLPPRVNITMMEIEDEEETMDKKEETEATRGCMTIKMIRLSYLSRWSKPLSAMITWFVKSCACPLILVRSL